jgi:hypothetical protein
MSAVGTNYCTANECLSLMQCSSGDSLVPFQGDLQSLWGLVYFPCAEALKIHCWNPAKSQGCLLALFSLTGPKLHFFLYSSLMRWLKDLLILSPFSYLESALELPNTSWKNDTIMGCPSFQDFNHPNPCWFLKFPNAFKKRIFSFTLCQLF